MIYNIIITLICIILPIIIFRNSCNIKEIGFKTWIKQNKYEIAIYIILVIGFMLRMVNIQNLPNALDCDEASSGYEAYAIGNYGIDRNGNVLPVFLVSWGSGQNALLTYLIIPFVKLFGLSVLTTRLPMAIVGCISLVVMYKLLRIIGGKKLAIIGLAFFTICPWHIMKSRWGLESNLFPDMVLLAVYLMISSLSKNKKLLFYLSFIILGLCAYAYGTSYFFLPLFIIPLLIYLIVKKKINISQAIISFGIVFIISLPIMLCVIINKFDLPEMKFLIFTIPRMVSNRYEELSSLFSGSLIKNSWTNFIDSMKILIFQYDKLDYNAICPYGIIYLFSLPLTIIGIVKNFKYEGNEKNIYKLIMNLWFIVSLLLLFVCKPNINRINIFWIPIIYYTIIGMYEVINGIPKTAWILAIIYVVSFVMFLNTYINTDSDSYMMFTNGVEDTIKYVSQLQEEQIYIQYKYKEPYIYMLFYTQGDPNEFINTVKYKKGNVINFENIKSYGKYYFYLPDQLEHKNGVAYVVLKNNNLNIDYSEWKTTYFEKFIVLENKE